MIALLPAPLHRLMLRVAHRLRLVWWSVRRAEIHGCNVVARNRDGAVLLVRHSYHAPRRWMLPGGGIARGERAEDAARRELREETGCRIDHPTCIAVEVERLGGARHHVHLVAATTADTPVADGRELIDARFYPADALPNDLARGLRRRIALSQAVVADPDGTRGSRHDS